MTADQTRPGVPLSALPPAAGDAIGARLKQSTREAHARVERLVTLLDPRLTRAAYRHWLTVWWGFYAPLEARLEAFVAALPADWPRRRKVPRLHADLLALGLTADQIKRLPRCQALPQLDTVPVALGCLYVLEGATLGGQLIARHLATTLGVTAATGSAFFTGYGPEVGEMWRVFQTHLRAAAATESSAQDMLRAAAATFAAFEQWLWHTRPEPGARPGRPGDACHSGGMLE